MVATVIPMAVVIMMPMALIATSVHYDVEVLFDRVSVVMRAVRLVVDPDWPRCRPDFDRSISVPDLLARDHRGKTPVK
jgi:hypothetical protein